MINQNELKPGGMVQIWDSQVGAKITGHGEVGYLVRVHGLTGKKTPDGNTTSSGTIWQVISFNHDPPEKYNVHECWLRPINHVDDIIGYLKKKT